MYNRNNLEPFKERIWLASPTTHGDELYYVQEAYRTNWISTVGENIDETEKLTAARTGVRYAVGLSCCTAALHLCVKLAGERLYGKPEVGHGSLEGKRVFCSDMTFSATLSPALYEGGQPVLIDTEASSWSMDPVALEKAFELYPDVKLVIYAELYGFPGKIEQIEQICKKHGALLIEDAAEAMGATVNGRPCGSFGDYATVSFNGNKIITGSAGGCFLTNSADDVAKVRKWSTQARETAPWYQHEEIGYNYRMSNVVAGMIRGQFPYLDEHIARKRAIFERYKEGFQGIPVEMNPYDEDNSAPNFWLSAMLIRPDHMCEQMRSDSKAEYISEHGKSCPTEILETLAGYNIEGRPIWKPMHLQPLYRAKPFVMREGNGGAGAGVDVGADIFGRGLCLPSDIKITAEQQDKIIEIVRSCFE